MTTYAIAHTYGHTTGDENGDHIGTLHIFGSRREAQAWTKRGNDFDGPGSRDLLFTRKRLDRRFIKAWFTS